MLLWNDQGIGDAIQNLRFAARIAEARHRVFVLVQEPLKSLAAAVPGVEAAFGPRDEIEAMDCQAPLCSLPHLLGVTPEHSWSAPYVHVLRQWMLPLGDAGEKRGMRVGLVWAGNPTHANDANRSMRLSDLKPLLDMPGVAWFSLQLGKGPAELAASRWAGRVHDLSPLLADFSATAAALMELDLLIAVDTAAAHLAGALGRPVWIALPAIGCDWRWGTTGQTTCWYPSVRLFRQQRPGDWVSTAAEMVDLLRLEPFSP